MYLNHLSYVVFNNSRLKFLTMIFSTIYFFSNCNKVLNEKTYIILFNSLF